MLPLPKFIQDYIRKFLGEKKKRQDKNENGNFLLENQNLIRIGAIRR